MACCNFPISTLILKLEPTFVRVVKLHHTSQCQCQCQSKFHFKFLSNFQSGHSKLLGPRYKSPPTLQFSNHMCGTSDVWVRDSSATWSLKARFGGWVGALLQIAYGNRNKLTCKQFKPHFSRLLVSRRTRLCGSYWNLTETRWLSGFGVCAKRPPFSEY